MSEHTKEPWSIDNLLPGRITAFHGGRKICGTMNSGDGSKEALRANEANAQRIVDCVNRFAGVDLEQFDMIMDGLREARDRGHPHTMVARGYELLALFPPQKEADDEN